MNTKDDITEPLHVATNDQGPVKGSKHPSRKSIIESLLETKLTPEQEELARSNKNICKVLLLAICFLFLFSAFNSASILVTPIYEQLGYNNFGKVSNLLIYVAFGFNDFLVSFELRALSQKLGLFIGSIGYTLFMLGGLLLTSCHFHEDEATKWWCNSSLIISANVFGSVTCGFCAALLWLAMASYIDCCANQYNKGKFFGLFWAIFQSSFILGNLFGAYLLKVFNQYYYFLCMVALATIACCLFLVLPNVKDFKAKKEDKPKLTVVQDIKLQMRGVKKFAFMPAFRPLIPYFLFSGFSVAVYSTFESTIIVSTLPAGSSENTKNERTEIVLIAQGSMSVITSYLVGKLFDLFDNMKTINSSNFAFLIAMAAATVGFYYELYFLAVMMGVFWAFGDSSVRLLSNAVIAKDFNGRLEAFAAARVFTEMGVIIGTLLTISLGGFSPYVLIIVIVVFTIAMQLLVRLYDAKKIKKSDIKEEESEQERQENNVKTA